MKNLRDDPVAFNAAIEWLRDRDTREYLDIEIREEREDHTHALAIMERRSRSGR